MARKSKAKIEEQEQSVNTEKTEKDLSSKGEKEAEMWQGPGNLIDRGRIIKPGDKLLIE